MPVPASLPTVGLTALGVAAIRAAETARSDRLFADPCAAGFVRAAGYERQARSAPSSQEEITERQRLTEWVGVRTRFLDDVVRSACAQGCRQVVILGAGLDARAFRVDFPEGTRLWELDLAGVLSFKELVVQAEAWVPRCERTTVEVDLSEDWSKKLQDAGFDARARVVWLAEGLLAYLSAQVRDALIAVTGALSVSGSRFGLTLAARTPAEEVRPANPRGEAKPRNYKALFQSTAPDDPREWLASHGWHAEFFDMAERSDSYGRPPRVDELDVDHARLVDATRL
jgi:methyltransferase (TIGR00027 family)